MSKLNAEQIEQLVGWREQGRSLKWIAHRLGVSVGAVNYQSLKHGAISPKAYGRASYIGRASFVGKDGRTFRRFSSEEDTRLQRLAAEGKRAGEIADMIGRPKTSVRMRLLTLGQHEDVAEAARASRQAQFPNPQATGAIA